MSHMFQQGNRQFVPQQQHTHRPQPSPERLHLSASTAHSSYLARLEAGEAAGSEAELNPANHATSTVEADAPPAGPADDNMASAADQTTQTRLARVQQIVKELEARRQQQQQQPQQHQHAAELHRAFQPQPPAVQQHQPCRLRHMPARRLSMHSAGTMAADLQEATAFSGPLSQQGAALPSNSALYPPWPSEANLALESYAASLTVQPPLRTSDSDSAPSTDQHSQPGPPTPLRVSSGLAAGTPRQEQQQEQHQQKGQHWQRLHLLQQQVTREQQQQQQLEAQHAQPGPAVATPVEQHAAARAPDPAGTPSQARSSTQMAVPAASLNEGTNGNTGNTVQPVGVAFTPLRQPRSSVSSSGDGAAGGSSPPAQLQATHGSCQQQQPQQWRPGGVPIPIQSDWDADAWSLQGEAVLHQGTAMQPAQHAAKVPVQVQHSAATPTLQAGATGFVPQAPKPAGLLQQLQQVSPAKLLSPRCRSRQQESSARVQQSSSPTKSPRLGWLRPKHQQQVEELQEALAEQQRQQEEQQLQLELQCKQQERRMQQLQAALLQQQEAHSQQLKEQERAYQQQVKQLMVQMQRNQLSQQQEAEQQQQRLIQQQGDKQQALLSKEVEWRQQQQSTLQELAKQVDRCLLLEAQVEVLHLRAEQAAAELQELQEQLAQAQADKSDLQLHCMQLKQKNKHLQDQQERLLEQNIDLQERQQQLLLQQLKQAEQEKAQRLQQQQEQLKVRQKHTQTEKELAAREATLAECHQQLQEAKAVLQAEVEQQHKHIKSMIQQLQHQEQLMIADVRAAKGAYVVDLKAETQRNHELSEQLAASKVKYKEASSKLKQLQRDHARLLDRKLEGDRRVSTLQQKVQDLKRKCVDSRGGEQSAPQASAARSALPKQQLDKGAASLSGVAEAEKAARLAAEAKVTELEDENRILGDIISTLGDDLSPLLQGIDKLQQSQRLVPLQQQKQQRQQAKEDQQQPAQVQQAGEPSALLPDSQSSQGFFLSPVKGLLVSDCPAPDPAAQQRNAAAAAILQEQQEKQQQVEDMGGKQSEPPQQQQQQQAQLSRADLQEDQHSRGAQRRLLPEFSDAPIFKVQARPSTDSCQVSSSGPQPGQQKAGPGAAAATAPAGLQALCNPSSKGSGSHMSFLRPQFSQLGNVSHFAGLIPSAPASSLGSTHGLQQSDQPGRLQQHRPHPPYRLPQPSHKSLVKTSTGQQLPQATPHPTRSSGFELFARWPLPQHPGLSTITAAELRQQQRSQQRERDQQSHRPEAAGLAQELKQEPSQQDHGVDKAQVGLSAGAAAYRVATRHGGLMSPSRASSPVAAGKVGTRTATSPGFTADADSSCRQQRMVRPLLWPLQPTQQQQRKQHRDSIQALAVPANKPVAILMEPGWDDTDGAGFSSPKEYSSCSVHTNTGEHSARSLMPVYEENSAAESEQAVAEAVAAAAKCRRMCDALHAQLATMLDGGQPTCQADSVVPCRGMGTGEGTGASSSAVELSGGSIYTAGAAAVVAALAGLNGSRAGSRAGRGSGRSSRASKQGSSVLFEQWSELQRQVQEVEAMMLDSEASNVAATAAADQHHTSSSSHYSIHDAADVDMLDTAGACLTTSEAISNQALVNVAVNMIGTSLQLRKADASTHGPNAHPAPLQHASQAAKAAAEAALGGDLLACSNSSKWSLGLPHFRGLFSHTFKG